MSEEKRNPAASSSSSSAVLKSAGAMGAATFLSRIMGLIREQVFAYLFGAGNMTDAFNVAFRIPNLLRDLFAEGAMSASLVPTFTQTRIEEGDQRAWRVAGLVFRSLFALVGLLSVLGIFFASELVGLYASGFKSIPGKFELTVEMTRIMFPFFPLVALAAAYMGILNACGVFFLPAFASALFNIGSVIVGVFFSQLFSYRPEWGISPIEGMAIGIVAGGAIQAFCQLPALYKKGYHWPEKRTSDPVWYHDPRLRRMIWLMVPGFVGLAATQVNILVNTILASSQKPGAVSWLNYSFRLMQFPIGVFGVSLAAATLPRIAQQWAKNEITGVTETLTRSLKTVFAINLPASAGLAFLGYPIIELIFEHGRFSATDTRATALALAMYSIGLPAYSTVKVLVPACYAFGNTRLPVMSSVLAVILTITLNLLMVGPFGYSGLALGTSIAAIFNSVFLFFGVNKLVQARNGKLQVGLVIRDLVAYTLIAIVMGVLCFFTNEVLNSVLLHFGLVQRGVLERLLGRGIKMLILMAEGSLFFLMVCKILNLKEANDFLNLFRERLKKKLSRA